MWWSATLDAVCTATNNARCLIARGTRRRLPMPLNDSPLDATIHVITPENIAFEYRLAGPFRRLPAFLLDLCIGAAGFIALAIGIPMTVAMASEYLPVAGLFLLGFIVLWFFGVLFLTVYNRPQPRP